MKSYKRDIPGYIILVSFPDLNPHGKGLVTFSNILGLHLIFIVQQVTCPSVASASCSSGVVEKQFHWLSEISNETVS